MTSLLQTVRPGDIITSRQFNDLITTLNALQARVAALETTTAANGVTFGSFDPPFSQAVGEYVTIRGTNFVTPLIRNGVPSNVVTFNGIAVPAADFRLAESSDFALTVRIPVGLDSPPGTLGRLGQAVTVVVDNSRGQFVRSYQVTSAVQAGNPAPIIQTVTNPNPLVGGNELFAGELAQIDGTDLGGTLANISLLITVGTAQITYPRVGTSDPAIVAEPGSTANRVTFRVPAAVGPLLNGQTRQGTVRVRVGAASPAVSSAVLFTPP
jgi:hypothetical protein